MYARLSIAFLSLVLAVSQALSALPPFGAGKPAGWGAPAPANSQQSTGSGSFPFGGAPAMVTSDPSTGSSGPPASGGTSATGDVATSGSSSTAGAGSGGTLATPGNSSTAGAGSGGASQSAVSPASSGASTGGPYDGRTYQGTATTDDADWSIGNCLLSRWPQPKGLEPLAIAQNLWDSSRMCGACVAITSSFGTHLGIVTDQSDVKPNSLDLGREMWSEVSNHQKSTALPITWQLVSCNFTAPMQFYNKEGVNPQYTAIQVAGANKPIKSLEAQVTDGKNSGGGGWVKLVRQSNSNHFTPSGGGLGTSADLRVTCDDGKQIITKGVSLVDSKKPTAASGNC